MMRIQEPYRGFTILFKKTSHWHWHWLDIYIKFYRFTKVQTVLRKSFFGNWKWDEIFRGPTDRCDDFIVVAPVDELSWKKSLGDRVLAKVYETNDLRVVQQNI